MTSDLPYTAFFAPSCLAYFFDACLKGYVVLHHPMQDLLHPTSLFRWRHAILFDCCHELYCTSDVYLTSRRYHVIQQLTLLR